MLATYSPGAKGAMNGLLRLSHRELVEQVLWVAVSVALDGVLLGDHAEGDGPVDGGLCGTVHSSHIRIARSCV